MSDVPRIVGQCTDPDTVYYTTVPDPYDNLDAISYVTHARDAAEAGTEYVYAVDDGSGFCGSFTLRIIDKYRAEVGYALHPDARGRGLSTPALRELIAVAWDDLDLRELTWRAIVGNTPSRAVAERVGFRVSDTLVTINQRGDETPAWQGKLKRKWASG